MSTPEPHIHHQFLPFLSCWLQGVFGRQMYAYASFARSFVNWEFCMIMPGSLPRKTILLLATSPSKKHLHSTQYGIASQGDLVAAQHGCQFRYISPSPVSRTTKISHDFYLLLSPPSPPNPKQRFNITNPKSKNHWISHCPYRHVFHRRQWSHFPHHNPSNP
jgi:hypothetical protein